ncbi:hypothetical protein CGK45_21925 [Vibrio parahaemolyticus]|uniref:hypothetical protein n=1 Tax=Vibrio parahaemolyticus TaxID=670 RepID=UPI0011220835|nr:hypothetical protein [Vibrio parahaemolyticus]TNZ56308.1 hypothetical protein CGK45_21925 [Vibrio parahaemolyticus]
MSNSGQSQSKNRRILYLIVLLVIMGARLAYGKEDCNKKCCADTFLGRLCEPTCKSICEASNAIEPTLPDCGGEICGALETGKNETRKVVNKTLKETENALGDIERWARTGNCGGDICDTLGKAIRDTHDEGKRTIDNLEEARVAAGKFAERQLHGVGDTLSDAERRLREGKVIDAMWHLATDPVKHTEDNAAKLAQESKYIRAVGQVAAGAYGGPGGSAAYAAWLTYKETGNFELAIKAGVITAATSMANAEISQMPSDQLASKAIVAGAVGGAAVAASGGDNQAVLEGFLLSGGMVVVQDGYKKITGHKLDEGSLKHSEGPAYCLKVTAAALAQNSGNSCIPKEDIYKRDKFGEILYEDKDKTIPVFKDKSRVMAALDARRPHVGKMAAPGETGLAQETGSLLKGVSKVPGMNAMAVFHDQWAINWDMDPVTLTATIPPAIVITYLGSGGPSYDLIRESNVKNESKEKVDYIDSVKRERALTNEQIEVAYEESVVSPSFICSKGNLVRQIAVEYPVTGSVHACRVLYLSEKGFNTPWHANNDKNYCLPRAEAFVAKQIVEFGWDCSGQ